MKLTSNEFKNNEVMPKVHAYLYGNKSPSLVISDIPSKTQTVAIIVDDPDAKNVPKKMGGQGKVWTHWTMWNIVPFGADLPEHPFTIPGDFHDKRSRLMFNDVTEGITSFGGIGYGGPAPPDKEHTYRFIVFALNCKLDLNQKATKDDLIKAMKGHILGREILLGRFEDPERQKKRLDKEAKK